MRDVGPLLPGQATERGLEAEDAVRRGDGGGGEAVGGDGGVGLLPELRLLARDDGGRGGVVGGDGEVAEAGPAGHVLGHVGGGAHGGDEEHGGGEVAGRGESDGMKSWSDMQLQRNDTRKTPVRVKHR